MGDLVIFTYERGEGFRGIGNREGGKGSLSVDANGRHFSVVVERR